MDGSISLWRDILDAYIALQLNQKFWGQVLAILIFTKSSGNLNVYPRMISLVAETHPAR